MQHKYEVIKDRVVRGSTWAQVGDIVWKFTGYDYGLAADDTHYTGEEHVSVADTESGENGSFTIPLASLKVIHE